MRIKMLAFQVLKSIKIKNVHSQKDKFFIFNHIHVKIKNFIVLAVGTKNFKFPVICLIKKILVILGMRIKMLAFQVLKSIKIKNFHSQPLKRQIFYFQSSTCQNQKFHRSSCGN